MKPILQRAVSEALGAAITGSRPLSGGDINQAYAISLSDGRRFFVKANDRAPLDMFEGEAHGLQWLAESETLRVPAVETLGQVVHGPAFLVLELLEPGARRGDYHEELGRGLAALHRSGAPDVGLDRDNYIATLVQPNQPPGGQQGRSGDESPAGQTPGSSTRWAEFYATCRLMPMVARAIDRGVAPRAWVGDFDRLYARLDELVGPDEPPARLHGDLWSGNLHVAPDGRPCLIDPAVYGGHREIDLAMLELFGSPPSRFWAAYDEAHPLAPGRDERVALYQLYPLLVHVNLFGGSYVGSVESALGRYR